MISSIWISSITGSGTGSSIISGSFLAAGFASSFFGISFSLVFPFAGTFGLSFSSSFLPGWPLWQWYRDQFSLLYEDQYLI